MLPYPAGSLPEAWGQAHPQRCRLETRPQVTKTCQSIRTNDTDARTLAVSATSWAAAFEWVAALAGQPGVVMWADEPVFYELHLQRGSLGVQPFPGSEQFDGVTPLWVEGRVISQASSRPGDVWVWLKLLSKQSIARPPLRSRGNPIRLRRALVWPLAAGNAGLPPEGKRQSLNLLKTFTWSGHEMTNAAKSGPGTASSAHWWDC